MTRKIIMINGRKRVGKTTIGRLLQEVIPNSHVFHLADHLRVQTQVSYGYYDFNPHIMEDRKDIPSDEFGGAKFRELCFSMAEDNMKKLHGKGFYAVMLCNKINKETEENTNIIIPDFGFVSECPSFINNFGIENMKFFRLFRPDIDIGVDTRSYMTWDQIAAYDDPPAKFQIGPHRFPDGIPEQPIHDIYNYPNQTDKAVQEILKHCQEWFPETLNSPSV